MRIITKIIFGHGHTNEEIKQVVASTMAGIKGEIVSMFWIALEGKVDFKGFDSMPQFPESFSISYKLDPIQK